MATDDHFKMGLEKDNAAEGSSSPSVRTLRNFRTSTDIEGLYRFVSENGLRRESHLLLETVVKTAIDSRRKAISKSAKKNARKK